jgi:hypothetical protein
MRVINEDVRGCYSTSIFEIGPESIFSHSWLRHQGRSESNGEGPRLRQSSQGRGLNDFETITEKLSLKTIKCFNFVIQNLSCNDL